MARLKFTWKRLRADREEDFNFESSSDDDEEELTAAAPGEKLSTADAEQRNIFKDVDGTLLQTSGKRRREIRGWDTQSPCKKPRFVQSNTRGIKPWGSWLGAIERDQRCSLHVEPTSVSRLAASNTSSRSSFTLTKETPARSKENPKLVVMRGDPTDWSTTAIVSDTNSLLHLNSGLAAKLVSTGGLEIQRQSTEWVCYNGEVPVGKAVWTTAGKLSSKFIIHTVGPDVSRHRWPTLRHQLEFRRAVRSALDLADDMGATSVAIPAICTGVSRYPKYLAAREIVAECLAFCEDSLPTTLRLIALMNEDQVTTSIFTQALKEARQQRQLDRQLAGTNEVHENVQTLDRDTSESDEEEGSPSDWVA